MYLIGLLSCSIFICVSRSISTENLPDQEWPLNYTFKAEKISLTAGTVEDIVYWRALDRTRVNYNKNAVQFFAIEELGLPYESIYKIHPETTDEKENMVVCEKKNETFHHRIELFDILPIDFYMFEHVGQEIVDNDTIVMFSYNKEYNHGNITKILWATVDQPKSNWRPVRYEVIWYNLSLGFKERHTIWKFYDFRTDVNLDDLIMKFDNCTDSEAKLDNLSESRNDYFNPEDEDHLDHISNSIINNFEDRTAQEMETYMGLIKPIQTIPDTHPFPYSERAVKELATKLPEEFDLRDLGIVTPARDQEECESSWTFAVTTAVEGALARRNGGRLVRLSNQALLDCAWGSGLKGCSGGNDVAAYRWIMKHGLPTEEEYGQYANNEGFCHIRNMTETFSILGYTNVTALSVEALKVALVNHGPIVVSMAVTTDFKEYRSGIYYDPECHPRYLNHQVALIGYGKRNGDEFWIIQNSKGQKWGLDGYAHISVRNNTCGITTQPTYPVL